MRNRLRGSLFGEDSAPVKVGRYVVLDKLGSGGLGVVYAAYDPKLDRRVALKLILPERITAEAAQRMQREAQAMAQLGHPNVVTVHDTGVHGQGTFIAMELVSGQTLRKWGKGDHRWTEVRDVLVAAGEGLVAAHRQGLIHRDFKPANVLVDEESRPRVLDFGLACSADEVHALTSMEHSPESLLGEALTETGVLMGTPQYMAPEQFAGRADARSDQWAFCVTAWELLYGVRPFTAPDITNLQRVIASGHIPGPPIDSPVPGWVERVLRRGLALDPAARFPDMSSLLLAMQKDKRSRRMQLLGLLGAVLLSAILTGSAMWMMRPQPTEESRDRIEQLVTEARDAASAGYYIYPPAGHPDTPTAFARVIALEQTEGPSAAQAKDYAADLRQELSSALVSLGDEYSERAGGEAFAADYYAAALVFDPENAQAQQRSSLTPGELSLLRRKAAESEFTDAELRGAQVLAALAESDEPRRSQRLAALYDEAGPSPAASTSLHLERLLGSAPQRGRGAKRRSTPIQVPPQMRRDATLEVADAGPDESEPEPEPDDAKAPSNAADGSDGRASPRSSSGRNAAAAEAKAGRAALARGDEAAAEQAFHRALNLDRRNLTALLGLSELYFERGAYKKSLDYARKATKVAPRSGNAHLQLGDACFKVHRYDDARKAYERAAELGHAGAKSALDRLDRRVGK